MLKKSIKFLGAFLAIIVIIGTLSLINLFLGNLKQDTFKDQVSINKTMFNNVQNRLLDNISIQYNTIVSNDLVSKVKDGTYINGDSLVKINFVDKELKNNKHGFAVKADDIYFTNLLKLNGENQKGYLEFSVKLVDFISLANEVYGKKLIFVFNETFLNDLDFNTKVKDFSIFLNNTFIKNNSLIEEELKIMNGSFISQDIVEINKNGFLQKENLFFTNDTLKSINSDKIGDVYIIEDKNAKGSTNYIVDKLEGLAQTIMMSVLSLLLAASLLLY